MTGTGKSCRDGATGYRPRPEAEGGGFEVDMTTLEMVGDGGLYTSVNELRRWERMFLDPAALGPDLLRRLTAPGRFNDGSAQDYAGGLGLGEYRGLATVSHGGSFVGFRTYALRFPEQAFAVFVLCNSASADPGALSRQVADLFLAAEMAPARDPARRGTGAELPIRSGRFWEAASASLASIERKDGGPVEGYPRDEEQPALADMVELAGAYRCRELDVSYEVRLDARPGLTLVGVNGERPLEPVFEDPEGPSPVYAWDRGTVRFLPDPGEARARGFELSAGRARGFLFVRE